MFLVDDILLSPIHGIMWVFREIYNAIEADKANESVAITTKLSELYMMLETGQLSEAEFDAAEKVLLDRLDALREEPGDDGGGDEEEEEEDGGDEGQDDGVPEPGGADRANR